MKKEKHYSPINSVIINTYTNKMFKEVLNGMVEKTIRTYDVLSAKRDNLKVMMFVLISNSTDQSTIEKMAEMIDGLMNDSIVRTSRNMEIPAVFIQMNTDSLTEAVQEVSDKENRQNAITNLNMPDGNYYFPLNVFINFDKDTDYDYSLRKLMGNILLHYPEN